MTISNTTNSVTHVGNGATASFPYSFRIDDEDHAYVFLIDVATGERTDLDQAEYTISGIGDDDGGHVTYLPDDTPIGSDTQIVIQRIVPYTQPTTIQNQSGFYPEVIEQQLDLMVMQVQQVANDLSKAMRVNQAFSEYDLEVTPDAGKFLRWTDTGIESVDVADIGLMAVATQPAAEAGVDNDSIMTPLRSSQFLAATVGAVIALGTVVTMGTGTGAALDRDDTDNVKESVLIGGAVLPIGTVADRIIGIGEGAYGEADPGPHNIAIGKKTLYHVTSGPDDAGSRNIAIGDLTGHFATTAKALTLIGRNAGHSITTANNITATGYRCLVGGFNPEGFSGDIITIDAMTNGGQTGNGYECLRYSNGQYNTGMGTSCGENIKAGDRNALFGARVLLNADEDLTVNNFTIDDNGGVGWSGTYTWFGTTLTILATGVNVAVGKRVRITFTTGDADGHTIEYTVVTAPDANTFTVTADASGNSSGNCTIEFKETATPGTASLYNVACGFEAGLGLKTITRSILLGAEAGEAGQMGVTTLDRALVVAILKGRLPFISGQLTTGTVRVGINCRPSDLTREFHVFNSSSDLTVGDELFGVDSARASVAGTMLFQFGSRTKISSPADGRLLLTKDAGSDFERLQLGGETNSFPMILRSGAALHFKLADNSAFANVQAAGITGTSATFSAAAIFSHATFTLSGIPTASPGGTGRVWNDAGTLKIT